MTPENPSAQLLHGLPLTRNLPAAPRLPHADLRTALLKALGDTPRAAGKQDEEVRADNVMPKSVPHLPATMASHK